MLQNIFWSHRMCT